MLELRDISVTLGDFSLRALDLTVAPGEYFVLLGPTGAGKTVLLEIVAGLLAPAQGTVRWGGEDLTPRPPEARPTAMVFQDLGLFPHLTVARNIGYGPRVRGLPAAEREARVERLAALMGIAPLLQRHVSGLSGGERQRVALARALAVEPRLLLLDEPLSALDTTTRERLRDELRRMHEESGATTLHVTHDREVALALADRVAVLLDRQLYAPRPPAELFRAPPDRAVAAFLGHRNLFDAEEVTAPLRTLCGAALPADAPGFWIRPEELRLDAEPSAGSAAVQVVDVRLLGSQAEVQLQLDETRLHARLLPGDLERRSITAGRTLYVTIPPDAVHAFER